MKKQLSLYLPVCFACALWLAFACKPYEKDLLTDVSIDFDNPEIRSIFDQQNRQDKDSLVLWFAHENPAYRYAAAQAFASVKDSLYIAQLTPLLQDPVDAVRAMTAYAIGQCGAAAGEAPLIAAFVQTDTAGEYAKSNRAILEAIGRCGSLKTLRLMATVSTYLPTDTALLEGQARGIYRFALRNITCAEGTTRMTDLAAHNTYPASVRLVAANYLARAADIRLDSLASLPLIEQFRQEADPYIRMALALALAKAPNLAAQKALLDQLAVETDYRVKCNILRTLSSFDYAAVQSAVIAALKDPNPHVAYQAAAFFVQNGIPQDATFYWRTAKDSIHWNAQLRLYAAALRHLPAYQIETRNIINWELRKRFIEGASPYQKAAALKALAEYPQNYRFIQRESYLSPDAAVRTAGVESLAAIAQRPDFNKLFGENARRTSIELALYFKQAIQSGDIGMAAVAASALRIPERNFKTALGDTLQFLDEALAKLSLPKDIETWQELQKTIAFLQGKPVQAPPTYDTPPPIAWNILEKFEIEPTAIIRTTKGVIRIKLLPSVAPGTVANFIRLARDKFYDGKYFHRVVPNFVIQGGCPRGDGYGALDYAIRSELPPLSWEQEGLVGMASAGNHTECTQFFITHSPALHLDGNYTIFARIIDGMDVVHQIQPGSKIESVVIQ